MTNEIDLTHTNKTIIQILSKFPPIQNNVDFKYYRTGKSFFYGLKSSDFNKFSEFENGDRIFNHWRDKLVQMRLLFKIYPKKERGSPYAITPLGIAYLVQNLEQGEIEMLNCYNVILHFFKGDKTGLKFDKLHTILYYGFVNACQMIKFKQNEVIFETSIIGGINFEIIHKKINSIEDNSAYYLIGNMCWIAKSWHVYSMSQEMISKNNTKYDTLEQSYDLLTKEVKVFGQLFGEKVVMPLFEAHYGLAKAILNFPNTKNK